MYNDFMAHRTLSDDDFLATALDLFRTYGYEGVSLKRLADATGLEKASLYYRYPGGKDAIAMAAAGAAVGWFQKNVFDPLAGSGAPGERVAAAAGRLREFYLGGMKSCILEALSIPGGSNELHSALKDAMLAWTVAFAGVAEECGLTPAAARARAEEAIVRIEGSLVLARVVGDNSHFERVLEQLPDLLTQG